MKVQLYSGGMDSWLIDKLWKPDVKVFFDIGTKNNEQELERVKKRDDVKIIKLPLAQFEQPENNYFLPLRNLHFVLYAAHFGDEICLGATKSSTHKDKNETFATLTENTINYLLSEVKGSKPVKVVMPFINYTKTEMLAEFIRQGGDIQECYEQSFSCYNPINGKPCMKCTSCLSKFTAFYNNGYPFTEKQREEFVANAKEAKVKDDTKFLIDRLDKKTIIIDFDNTVTTKSKYPVMGKLADGCAEKLNELKAQGYRLVLYTARQGNDLRECILFCKEHKLPFDEYVGGKLSGAYYIDDKAVDFKGWENVNIKEEE